MKKEFQLIEVLNLVNYFNNLPVEKRNALPLKVHYAFKKFIDKITPDAKRFEEFRDEELKKIQDEWFTEERSYECEIPRTKPNGEVETDEEGNQITDTGRKLKEEYLEGYNNVIKAFQEKINEIVYETNSYEYNWVDISAMVESLPDDTPLENGDIDLLDIIFDNTTSTEG